MAKDITKKSKKKGNKESKKLKKNGKEKVAKKKEVVEKKPSLPKEVLDKKIIVKDIFVTENQSVNLSDITGTSKSIYVDDIHNANPQILHTVYRVLMPNHRYIVARCEKDQYDFVLANAKLPKDAHRVTVIDTSIVPTLSYGWNLHELSDELPTLAQVESADQYFRSIMKDNGPIPHNPAVKIKINEQETDEDDEELIFLDEDDEDEVTDDEEEFVLA